MGSGETKDEAVFSDSFIQLYKNILNPGTIEFNDEEATKQTLKKPTKTKPGETEKPEKTESTNFVKINFPAKNGNINFLQTNEDEEFLKKRQKLLYSSIYIINSINYLNKILSSNTVKESINKYKLKEFPLETKTFDGKKMFENDLTEIKPLSNNLILLDGLNTGGIEETGGKKFEYQFIQDFLKILKPEEEKDEGEEKDEVDIHKFNINIVRPCRDKKDCSEKLEIKKSHFNTLEKLDELISIILEDTLEQTLRSFQKFVASSHGLLDVHHVIKQFLNYSFVTTFSIISPNKFCAIFL